ncbi:class I SAM-dependent methyltransferase [Parabacteroides sp. PF5-9]|uniref:class I SAM-dependent methyltransferase n=1 Tax=Parabacteroides sp. PF5-9 TaxID=1742404 RepID=UPI0024746D58|nr:class I SAM-dependent methyltransferase [Parabacteroides sp. PF5-9]MDH6359063.1 cyclopropane fatty-acyl-phospholipid synthase-like methyltransferase [Parabacteroides sp. PF5-9]
MGLLREVYYALPPSLRFVARRVYYFPVDLYEGIAGKRGEMIPPRGMIFIGAGDFRTQGLHILDLLKRYAGLTPGSRVLDVGCGIGRLAVALTGYLDDKGSYEGFDIVRKGIDWCEKKISSNYPRFRFKHIDLKNDLYNLSTEEEAKHFVFPYAENSFDCVVLTSVFTHMMPEDVDNYLGQIASVMKKEGKCLATFFLINPEIKERMVAGNTQFNFKHTFEGYSLMDKKVKEANIAFDEEYLQALIRKNGMQIDSVHYGRWSYSPDALDFQDVMIISKKE